MFVEICGAECSGLINSRNFTAQLKCHHKYNDGYDNVDHYEMKTEHGLQNKIWI